MKHSYIVVSKRTGKAILETWNKGITDKVNRDKYDVLTAYDYLCKTNQQIAKGKT